MENGIPLRPACPAVDVGNETPHISVRIPHHTSRDVPLSQPVTTLGRFRENDVVISLPIISKNHGRIEKEGSRYYYRDLGSKNGSFLNGHLVQYKEINDGDILTLGDIQGEAARIVFFVSRASAEAPLNKTQLLDIDLYRQQGRQRLMLGRGSKCDFHLDSPLISRLHAQITFGNQGDVLTDLNSTNGTFVNGAHISQPHLLRDGDIINIGPFCLNYGSRRVEQRAMQKGVRLDGMDVMRRVGRGASQRTILNDINITIYPREFVALVGGSGAGKSTLMKALNGVARPQGRVLIQGGDLYQNYNLFRRLIGYVPQEDIIHKELTVYRALRYAAELRLPSDTSHEEIDRRIDRVLEQVNMLGQIQQVVSSLSGGQRKRVSIAVELLADPRLFFLDEPTSGLDPGLEKKMMSMMRGLADEGRTIILVTHATASISQCDHVCFLSNGYMTYFGPPSHAPGFFEVPVNNDFSDIYECLDDPDPRKALAKALDWSRRFKQSSFYRKYISDRMRTLPAQHNLQVKQKTPFRFSFRNGLRQFTILVRRYFDLVIHDKFLLAILVAIMPLIGFLLLMIAEENWLVGDPGQTINQILTDRIVAGQKSAIYAIVGNAQTMLFMLALAVVLLGLFASAYEIVRERPIYERERAVVLQLLPYLASKVVVLGGFAAVQCFLLLIVVGMKVDFPPEGVILPAFWEMYLTLLISALAAIMVGLFISACVPNNQPVIYVIMGVLFFQIIFAGVFFEMPGITKSLSNFTLSRWTTESLGISADIDALNGLTMTRFDMDPIVEKRDVEVQIPGPTCYNNVPVITNEWVTKEIEVNPGPVDIATAKDFQIDYERNAAHLFQTWWKLSGFTFLFFFATLGVLRWKETRSISG